MVESLVASLPTTWQDWIFSAGQIVFFLALLPSVLSQDKPHLYSSLLTGIILSIFTITFWTLELTWSSVTSGVVAATWLTLAYQKYMQKYNAS